jgi:hypothetical protein
MNPDPRKQIAINLIALGTFHPGRCDMRVASLIAALIGCLLVGACTQQRTVAAVQEPVRTAASAQEKDAANRAYVACLWRAALKFDDRSSDAGSVASGIIPICHTEFVATVEVWGRALDSETRRGYEDLRAPREEQYAIEIVLRVRSSAKRQAAE